MESSPKSKRRIPREKTEQNERLTTKHIQTLSFLQEIVNENKILKAKLEELENKCKECDDLHEVARDSKERIKTIQEQYLNRADEINAILIDKHKQEMSAIIEEKVENERKWEIEKRELKTLIEELTKNNQCMSEKLQAYSEDEGKVQIMTLKLETLESEIATLKDENTALRQANKNQLQEIQRQNKADGQNEVLVEELKAVNQKNKELKFKITKLEKELEESQSNSDEKHLAALEKLRKKLEKLTKEKDLFAERYEEKVSEIEMLSLKLEQFEKLLSKNHEINKSLEDEVRRLLEELTMLKRQPSGEVDKNKTFREYVALKREMASVKAENEDLRQKLVFKPKSLPSLKMQSETGVVHRKSMKNV